MPPGLWFFILIFISTKNVWWMTLIAEHALAWSTKNGNITT
jgi:hypothetical protein